MFCKRGDTVAVLYLFRKMAYVSFKTAHLMRFLSNKWCDFQTRGFKFELLYAGRMRQSERKKG